MSPGLIDLIEGVMLSAELNAASGYTQFMSGLGSCGPMETLRQEAAPSEVLGRLLHLVDAPFDTAYENPADVAVTAYLLFLTEKGGEDATTAATAVLTRGRNFYWAAKLAGRVAEQAARAMPPAPRGSADEAALATPVS